MLYKVYGVNALLALNRQYELHAITTSRIMILPIMALYYFRIVMQITSRTYYFDTDYTKRTGIQPASSRTEHGQRFKCYRIETYDISGYCNRRQKFDKQE